MSRAADLLSELTTRGVVVAPDRGCLRLYPRSALNPDLLARVRALKPQLLELLQLSAGAVASPAEWKVLSAVALHPGLTPEEVTSATKLAPATMDQTLRTLTQRAEVTVDVEGKLHLRIM
jgi:hypothetical protein